MKNFYTTLLVMLISPTFFHLYCQNVHLAELLKNHESYLNKTIRVVVAGENISITRDESWITQVISTGCNESMSFANHNEIDTPKKITDYLKAEGFTIDFVQDSPDEYGNLYAYFKYEENYWKASFSCGSKGCGVDFYLLP